MKGSGGVGCLPAGQNDVYIAWQWVFVLCCCVCSVLQCVLQWGLQWVLQWLLQWVLQWVLRRLHCADRRAIYTRERRRSWPGCRSKNNAHVELQCVLQSALLCVFNVGCGVCCGVCCSSVYNNDSTLLTIALSIKGQGLPAGQKDVCIALRCLLQRVLHCCGVCYGDFTSLASIVSMTGKGGIVSLPASQNTMHMYA